MICAFTIFVFAFAGLWSRGSRGALCLLLFLLGMLVDWMRKRRYRILYFTVLLSIIFGLTLTVVIILSDYKTHIISSNPLVAGVAKLGIFYEMYVGVSVQYSGRYAAIARVPRMLAVHPLLGIGFANYYYFSNIQPFLGDGSIWPGSAPANLYLDVAGEFGILGLSLLMIVELVLVIYLLRKDKSLFFILVLPILGYTFFAVKWETFLFMVIGLAGYFYRHFPLSRDTRT